MSGSPQLLGGGAYVADDLRAVIVDTVQAVSEPAWDAVAAGEWSYSHRWQRVMERELRGYRPAYVLIYAAAELIGVAFSMELPEYLLPKRFPRSIQPLIELVLRATMQVCATPLSSRLEGLMIKPGWPEQEPVVALALRALDRMNRSARLLQVFAATTAHHGRVLHGLQQRGYQPIQVSPYMTLDVVWTTFDDYLASLPRKRRTDLRRQLNNAQRHGGIKIEQLRPDQVTVPDADLYRLIDNVAQRYGEKAHVVPSFFSALRTLMPDNSTIFLATVDGQLAGVFVGIHDDNSISFPMIGQDHALSREHGIYFLLHFAVIRYAIERQLRLINMGLTQLDLKRRLGYQPNPRYFIVRSPYRLLDRVLQLALRQLAPRLIPALAQSAGGER